MSDAPAAAVTGESVRCFLALLPGAAGRDTLRHCRESLEPAHAGAAHGVRWADAASLHLTLRFLGEATVSQVEYLTYMLPTLARALPAIDTRRCAIWPNRARPRLLVLELDQQRALAELAHACELQARAAGFPADTRGFRAHLTLARLRPGCVFGQLSAPPPSLAFDTLALMRSTLARPASTYTPIASASVASPSRTGNKAGDAAGSGSHAG